MLRSHMSMLLTNNLLPYLVVTLFCFSRSLSHCLALYLARSLARTRKYCSRARPLSHNHPHHQLTCSHMRESPGICYGHSIPFPWVKESSNQFSGKTSHGWIEAMAFIGVSASNTHLHFIFFWNLQGGTLAQLL